MYSSIMIYIVIKTKVPSLKYSSTVPSLKHSSTNKTERHNITEIVSAFFSNTNDTNDYARTR